MSHTAKDGRLLGSETSPRTKRRSQIKQFLQEEAEAEEVEEDQTQEEDSKAEAEAQEDEEVVEEVASAPNDSVTN